MSLLFQPFLLNQHVNLKNRLVFPPITTGYAGENGEVTEKMCAYYSEKAKNGPGMIVVEAAVTSPSARLAPRSPGIWNDMFIRGLSGLCNSIKSQSVVPFLQLAHAGFRTVDEKSTPVGPSRVSLKKNAPQPHKLSKKEINQIIEGFISGAERAKKAGFSGVELHCAHFYLLSSFLSSVTNHRKDEYGGSIQGKCRIVKNIIEGIKEKVGEAFAVGCRINGTELAEKGIEINEAVLIAQELERAGADVIHVSAYNVYIEALKRFVRVPALAVPRKNDPPGTFVSYAEEVRKHVTVPVIAVGKINTGDLAEEIISLEKSDLVAIGRPLIADPHFITKSANKEPVIACKYCLFCLKAIRKGEIKCRVNPRIV